MAHKIFKSPMLKTFGQAKTQAPEPKRTVIAPEIPMPSPYRVDPLVRMSTPTSKWRTEAMRSHRSPTLLWFTRGQGRITVSGVTRGFGGHNLIYLPTKTMYGFEAVGQAYGTIVHLDDDPDLGLPDQPLHMRFSDLAQQNHINGMIEALAREIDQDAPNKARALALHAGLLSVWLNRQIDNMPDYDMTPDASRRLTAAFTALVEDGYKTTHKIADYAAKLGVTPTHLTRACNVACGRPASALIADRVHFEARRLLKETQYPVKTIGETLGFHSPAYFARAFQKHTGSSPRAFRKAD
ncbi:AraC family transcriptional regulator [Pacificibacter maritimus]|uniref:AraC family transcriptional regulator n=1 Tax=Pacificibacter maritimus TaxID=762213 RepID=A0A3N4ULI0_9RHOB|nr:AraC family transcriptional regulator [Pacificibacter maritimus]RPE71462.1 AraC family transcriptional regulator [Pacificibacter maritimus]